MFGIKNGFSICRIFSCSDSRTHVGYDLKRTLQVGRLSVFQSTHPYRV